jgi:methylase of polypeptide subunit release factors
MKDALLTPTSTVSTLRPERKKTVEPSPNTVFFCPEESRFYSQCLEKMVFNQASRSKTIVEFGAGDGCAVINSLLKSAFRGTVHGYELNPKACQVAQTHIQQQGLHNRYIVHNQCFFEGLKQTQAHCLIANPPYIPAPDDGILMPELHGGIDGATITKNLLTLGCEQVLLMISAYSNPVETIHHALAQGYQVVDFLVTPLPFGYYSSEPKVKNWIARLRSQNKAFYSPNIYFLTGVLFQKRPHSTADLSVELLKVITAL